MYPKFRNKHLEEPLVQPMDYINWAKLHKHKNLPSKYILIYYQKILQHFIKKYKPKKIHINRLITVYKYKDLGVVRLPGIGSPHAVMVLEELIPLGGKEFLNIGSAGGLDDFGVYLCTKALRDEGTSYHYLSHGKFTFPDKELTKKFEKILDKKMVYQKSPTWTIDAPYKETKTEIKTYKKMGIKTVEMESSALFAVANFRKVKIASAFVISDVLGEHKWNPQFDSKHVNLKLNQLFDAAVECLL